MKCSMLRGENKLEFLEQVLNVRKLSELNRFPGVKSGQG